MDVRYAKEVRDDLLVSMAWLDERRTGLGDELESEFYAAVSIVQERPFSFASDHTGYRPCRLRRFTAVLYYRIESDIIMVMGLFVAGRDESRLQDRSEP
ncbi:type II toxin-antitoxin system RelE/ParE family toxin [Crateriforma conspicua]|uniref:Plasmid stabilization system protein n=1 Tax=Crateriforma conspicua TaxID=2527996 RepID=A0A5C5YB71_9PLAN|nr:hypothetical protein Pan14r_44100 [Crateriforma conspicua]